MIGSTRASIAVGAIHWHGGTLPVAGIFPSRPPRDLRSVSGVDSPYHCFRPRGQALGPVSELYSKEFGRIKQTEIRSNQIKINTTNSDNILQSINFLKKSIESNSKKVIKFF